MRSEPISSLMRSSANYILLGAIIVCSSCEPTFDQNVKQKQKRLNALTEEIGKSAPPEKIIACGRVVIAAVSSNKYANGGYQVPKTEFPSCWPSLGLDEMVVSMNIDARDGSGPYLIVWLKIREEEIVLIVYSQGGGPDPDVVKSPYSKKWHDGLYVLYAMRP
jgi:hypothetical protein